MNKSCELCDGDDFDLANSSSMTTTSKKTVAADGNLKRLRNCCQLWSDTTIQKLFKEMDRNKSIWERIASDMTKEGHKKAWEQYKNRIKNLTSAYRKVKEHKRISGKAKRPVPNTRAMIRY